MTSFLFKILFRLESWKSKRDVEFKKTLRINYVYILFFKEGKKYIGRLKYWYEHIDQNVKLKLLHAMKLGIR